MEIKNINEKKRKQNTQNYRKSVKNKIFIIILGLGLIFFGLNIIFEFIKFENSKVNLIGVAIIICVISLFKLKKKESTA